MRTCLVAAIPTQNAALGTTTPLPQAAPPGPGSDPHQHFWEGSTPLAHQWVLVEAVIWRAVSSCSRRYTELETLIKAAKLAMCFKRPFWILRRRKAWMCFNAHCTLGMHAASLRT